MEASSVGIQKSLETLESIGNLSVDAIAIVKAGGFKLSVLPKILDALNQINELVKDAPAALPELADIDAQEAAQLGAASFALVKKVIVAISA